MAKLEEYANKYETVNFERRDGILQVTFHSHGGSLKWGGPAHREFGYAFADIGSDPENRVVIITGTGDDYCAEFEGTRPRRTPKTWDVTYWEGKRLLTNLLEIEVPIIGAVNGPALIHAEIPVMSDIVLASENATFQDAPHFPRGVVPGQVLSAQEAHQLGVVAEVLPRERLLPRARELAEQLCQQPDLTLRYARVAITLNIKRQMQDMLGYGLAIEGLAAVDV